MKQKTLLFVLFCFSSFHLFAQVEDFEGEMLGGNTFTVETTVFNLTGDLVIGEFDDFSCDGSTGPNRYMDSGYQDSVSVGVLGTFAPAESGVPFQMSTTVPQCIWPGSGDGEFISTGTIRFTGTKEDDTTITEEFTIASVDFSNMLPFTFTDSIWGGVSLKSMELEMVATEDSTDYWAFDNLVFESVGTVSAVNIDKEAITIYPNPTTGKITLNAIEAEEVKIYNSLGDLVKTGWITNQELDISNLPNGVYYLSIYNENQSIVKRILKQ